MAEDDQGSSKSQMSDIDVRSRQDRESGIFFGECGRRPCVLFFLGPPQAGGHIQMASALSVAMSAEESMSGSAFMIGRADWGAGSGVVGCMESWNVAGLVFQPENGRRKNIRFSPSQIR